MIIIAIINKKTYQLIETDENTILICRPDYLSDSGLAIGDELNYSRYLNENHDFCKDYGFQKALDYLSYSARTQQQIIDHLKTKHLPFPIITEIIAKLVDYRLADDAMYAQQFTDSAKTSRKGKHYISRKLKAKGVDDSHIEEALDSYSIQDEKNNLQQFILKQDDLLRQYPPLIRKEKIYRKSLSQGFSSAIISEAINNMVSNDQEQYDDYFRKRIEKKVVSMRNRGLDEVKIRQNLYRDFLSKGAKKELIDEILLYEDKSYD